MIPYEKRENSYCNSSCFASENNKGKCRNKAYYSQLAINKPKKETPHILLKKEHPKRICLLCGISLTSKYGIRYGTFCNNAHASLYKTKQLISSNNATHKNKTGVKKYLVYIRGNKCEICKREIWQVDTKEHKIPLDMHHIDGDVENMELSNLQLVCPICHTFTPNYKSKNKNGHTNRKTYQKKRGS